MGIGIGLGMGWGTVSLGGGDVPSVPFEFEFTPRGNQPPYYYYIGTNPSYVYDYDVSVSTGETFSNETGDVSLLFTDKNPRTVAISGVFPNYKMSQLNGNYASFIGIIAWGNQQWKSMYQTFYRASNITSFASDLPDLSIVTSMEDCFNQTNILFANNIGDWDVSNVETIRSVFFLSNMANIDITNWNVSNVTNFRTAFGNSTVFSTSPTDLTGWDVGSGSSFQGTFQNTSDFNQDISSWDMSNAVFLQAMFLNATSFNQPIGNWNTANVTSIREMLNNASAFDQDLSNWNILNITDGFDFLKDTGLSTANYDSTLISWAAQNPTNNVVINFGSSQYTAGGAAETARTSLINSGWTITDGGAVPVYTTNLVASYSFDTDFTDYTGNNDLTAFGNVVAGVAGGVVDDCADFDGTSDYTVAADSDDFSFTDGVTDLPFSVSFWLNVDTVPVSGAWILSKRLASSTNDEYQINFSSSTFEVFLASQGSTTSYLYATFPYTPTTGGTTWEHFTVTYDGSETFGGITMYADGVSQTLTNSSSGTYLGMNNTATLINIGSRSFSPTTGEFDGKMDEFHVWKNRELTQAEVTDIYTTELGGTSILPALSRNIWDTKNYKSSLTDSRYEVERPLDSVTQDFSQQEIEDGTFQTWLGADTYGNLSKWKNSKNSTVPLNGYPTDNVQVFPSGVIKDPTEGAVMYTDEGTIEGFEGRDIMVNYVWKNEQTGSNQRANFAVIGDDQSEIIAFNMQGSTCMVKYAQGATQYEAQTSFPIAVSSNFQAISLLYSGGVVTRMFRNGVEQSFGASNAQGCGLNSSGTFNRAWIGGRNVTNSGGSGKKTEVGHVSILIQTGEDIATVNAELTALYV